MTTGHLGYRSPHYLDSLTALGRPRALERSGGWVIERAIPGSERRDAMGPYPLFSCRDWEALSGDLDALRADGLLSLLLVTDPMADEHVLRALDGFDLKRPFKTHYLAELDRPPERIASRHHAYYARRAARSLSVREVADPLAALEDWVHLYDCLVARHHLHDLRAFRREAFSALLRMPDVVLFIAEHDGVAVGAQVMLLQDEVAHAHLSAFDDTGYRLGASYLLDWHATAALSDRARYINWGGGRGGQAPEQDGLTRYKQGWATCERTSWLLGSVLDAPAYASLSQARGMAPDESWFPAYRRGEFS